MKRVSLILIFLSLLCVSAFPQGCLPEGISFSTQEQIDSFPYNYPGCSIIQGSVTIYGDSIYNIDSLIYLTRIGGDLGIYSNPNLKNIDGASGISSIGGSLTIYYNINLTDINGFQNLNVIEGGLFFGGPGKNGNPWIQNMQGFCSLDSILGYCSIACNGSLLTLDGLDSLKYIGSGLRLWWNNNLTDLNGLEGIKELSSLSLDENYDLNDISGLRNLETLGGLGLTRCLALDDLSGFSGLKSLGFLSLWKSGMSTVAGLESITMLNGYLMIDQCSYMEDLEGLDNITHINGDISISQSGIVSLDNLNKLGSINGQIILSMNSDLNNINGLANIDATTISNLMIYYNTNLSFCGVKSICEYLSDSLSAADIAENAAGCETRQKVISSCSQSIDELPKDVNIRIFPNPADEWIHLICEKEAPVVSVRIFNSQGDVSYSENGYTGHINVSAFPSGLYLVIIESGDWTAHKKLIVQ